LRGSDSFAEIHPDDREQIKQAFRDTVQTGTGQQAEYRFVLGDGRIRHMESSGGVIRDSQGRPLRVVVVARDISERKQAEAVQLARNAVLDQIVANRPLPAILDDIARRLEAIGTDMRVSILLLDPRSGLLSIGAAPSLPAFYNEAVEGLEPGEGAVPAAQRPGAARRSSRRTSTAIRAGCRIWN